MNPPVRVRITSGPYRGREGTRTCRASDQVFVRLRLSDGTIDQVPVNERHVQDLP